MLDQVTTIVVVSIVFGAIFLAPVFLFRPLVLALANRIAGKTASNDEVKALRAKVQQLEDQVHAMSTRMLVIEDGHEFSKKMLEDAVKKSGAQK